MINREITIREFELKSSDENLNKLAEYWSGVPNVSDTRMKKSAGHVRVTIDSCVHETVNIKNAMDELLTNTVQFFANVGVTFADADANAACLVASVGGKSSSNVKTK